MAKAKLRGSAALSPKQKGFAVAALAAMLAPALVVGTKLVDWVNLSKHQDIAVALGPADVFGALRVDPAELGASGRLPLSEELSAALLADLEDGDLDLDLDDGGVIDDFPGDHGIPGVVLEAYLRAEDKMGELVPGCNLDWALLAGIGKVESNHASNGRLNAVGDATPKILGPVLNGAPGMAAITDTDDGRLDGDTAWDRAVGPMQFIPSTWASFGADGNEDGNVNPNNIYDAALGAGRYLCAGGGDLSKQDARARAIFRYNNSTTYVETVLKWAKQYSDNVDALPLLPDIGNNQQNPTPNNPATPPGNGNGNGNGNTGTPSTSPSTPSTPPSSSTPNCPTPTSSTPPTSSSSTPPSSTPSTSCPPTSSTPPSSSEPSTPPPSSSSNPPQTEPSTPPASEPSSGTSQSTPVAPTTTTTTSVNNDSSAAQPTTTSLVTSTPN
ncbi:Transglycosylase SLT domain-containing protein [Lentzea xinjiangensis]|uniref:Transglycosylase SLT domain-containing protein n=1 Tax=Lentzea xinjiangensis TaxID=402600 RepID=A0A1H9E059_9PSEU|nr:lytic transglycosylase domain-containing protein [Lentzea xinjiangensis]SEQ18573.1 Transglycosylase SLT domain-containing protein [Lentzea xinjiangensis]